MSNFFQRTCYRCFLPSFGSFGQAVSEEKIFLNRPIRNKNCLWWPCLLMDQDEMSSLYRGPAVDASYQVSVHLAKRFQRRRFFLNGPIRNKICIWRLCLLMVLDKMSNLQRGPSIDTSYQVSLHLAEGFQSRRLKCEKRRRMPSDGKSSHCLWQGELKTISWSVTVYIKNLSSHCNKKKPAQIETVHNECRYSVVFPQHY